MPVPGSVPIGADDWLHTYRGDLQRSVDKQRRELSATLLNERRNAFTCLYGSEQSGNEDAVFAVKERIDAMLHPDPRLQTPVTIEDVYPEASAANENPLGQSETERALRKVFPAAPYMRPSGKKGEEVYFPAPSDLVVAPPAGPIFIPPHLINGPQAPYTPYKPLTSRRFPKAKPTGELFIPGEQKRKRKISFRPARASVPKPPGGKSGLSFPSSPPLKHPSTPLKVFPEHIMSDRLAKIEELKNRGFVDPRDVLTRFGSAAVIPPRVAWSTLSESTLDKALAQKGPASGHGLSVSRLYRGRGLSARQNRMEILRGEIEAGNNSPVVAAGLRRMRASRRI